MFMRLFDPVIIGVLHLLSWLTRSHLSQRIIDYMYAGTHSIKQTYMYGKMILSPMAMER